MKFAHIRVSEYFTAKLFHMAKPYFTRRRRISLKKAHIVLVDKCVLFSGGEEEIRTLEPCYRLHDFQSCALDQLGDFSICYLICRRFSHQAYVLYHTCFEKSTPFFNFLKNIFSFLFYSSVPPSFCYFFKNC